MSRIEELVHEYTQAMAEYGFGSASATLALARLLVAVRKNAAPPPTEPRK